MPFIMKAGKALGERKAEVRIQFRNSSHLLHGKATEGMRNELVVSGPLTNHMKVSLPHDHGRALPCVI